MITEDYVSFETAKLLKEKGFYSEDCFAFYKKNGKIGFLQTFGDIADYDSETCVISPTLQMAMKWLREEKGLHIHIGIDLYKFDEGEIKFFIEYYSIKAPFKSYSYEGEHIYFDNYKQAADVAIKYYLEHLF